MVFRSSVGVVAIATTAAFVLSFHGVDGSKQIADMGEHPQLTECTQREISRCYTKYAEVFFWPQLQWKEEEEFNEEAYGHACRFFNETSSCYEGFNRCPESMRNNFTRREEGYRAYRAMVCDSEVFKGRVENSMLAHCVPCMHKKSLYEEYLQI